MELLFLSEPAFRLIVALASELIALSPLKENSVIQSVITLLNKLKPDDKKESKLAKWWRRFLTGSTPDYKEVGEDE